ncbi:MAG TPA: DoxX family protein [Gemmataceae bacterium]|nr:DoxX family protein [Gemmataceae bacterium]
MFEAFCKEKLGPLSLRLALGSACVYHGYLRIMVAGGTAWYPSWPVGWQLLIAWGEFGAGLAILLGFRCRVAAALVLAITAGTLAWWQGWNALHLPLRTLEPTVLLLLLGLALVFVGAGGLSLDSRSGGGLAMARPAKKR